MSASSVLKHVIRAYPDISVLIVHQLYPWINCLDTVSVFEKPAYVICCMSVCTIDI